MGYAIITMGGKQYRVREGERLLVDRVDAPDGGTLTAPALLVGGNGAPQIAPEGVVVTARVVEQRRGPKIRIGKYRQRTGYKRHTGFRSALTQIEIESIGASKAKPAARKAQAETEAPAPEVSAPKAPAGGVPSGYPEMTVANVKDAAGGWELPELRAALEHEQAHGQRKGAIAALEAAIAAKEAD